MRRTCTSFEAHRIHVGSCPPPGGRAFSRTIGEEMENREGICAPCLSAYVCTCRFFLVPAGGDNWLVTIVPRGAGRLHSPYEHLAPGAQVRASFEPPGDWLAGWPAPPP